MTLIVGILALRDREISGTADLDLTYMTLLSKKAYPLRGIMNKPRTKSGAGLALIGKR